MSSTFRGVYEQKSLVNRCLRRWLDSRSLLLMLNFRLDFVTFVDLNSMPWSEKPIRLIITVICYLSGQRPVFVLYNLDVINRTTNNWLQANRKCTEHFSKGTYITTQPFSSAFVVMVLRQLFVCSHGKFTKLQWTQLGDETYYTEVDRIIVWLHAQK